MNSRRPSDAVSARAAGIPLTQNIAEKLCLLVVLLSVFLFVVPTSGIVIVEYFHQPGCTFCEKTDPVIDSIRTQYGDRITLETIEVDDRAGVRLLMSYGVTEIPVVVINHNKVLSYIEITPERLDEEIRLAESGSYPIPAARKSILGNDPLLAAFFSFILGSMTGLSPCLLGSLVLLVATAGHGAPGRHGRYYPLVYGAGIVTAYLVVAAGILGAGIALMPEAGSRIIISSAGGIIAILAGLVQIGLFSVPDRLTRYSTALVSRFHTIPGIFLFGILFAVLFAPCAIAPFLILIETLLIDRNLAPALMLFFFSLGILVPFSIFAVLRNSAQERLLKYTRIVQKAGGILLIMFGIWLILLA